MLITHTGTAFLKGSLAFCFVNSIRKAPKYVCFFVQYTYAVLLALHFVGLPAKNHML